MTRVTSLTLVFGLLMTPAALQAQVPASATGGSTLAIQGRAVLTRTQLQDRISHVLRDSCYGPSSPVPGPAGSGSGQTPPYVVKWKACLPALGGLPADPQIAAGTTRLVLTNQSRVAFYDKSGTYHGSLSAASFFAPLGLDNGSVDGLDTFRALRVAYDAHRGRFWLGGTATNGGQADPAKKRVVFVLAVSQTSSPLGGWWLYWWDAVTGFGQSHHPVYQPGDIAEDPFIAIDKFGLHQTNMVRNGGLRRYWRVTFFPAALASGMPASGWQYWDLKNPNGTSAWMVQPAMHHGVAPRTYYASRQGTSDVVVWGLSDPLGPSQSLTRVAVAMPEPWSAPTNAPQEGSWQKIRMDRLSTSLLKAVYRGGRLHLVSNDGYDWYGDGPLASVRVIRLDVSSFPTIPTDPSSGFVMSRIGKSSTFDDADPKAHMYYGWPTAEVNGQGDMAIGLARSGADAFPEMRWSVLGSNAAEHKPSFRVQLGAAPYEIPGNNASVLPWGEAAGASVDPADDHSVWLAHQVASPSGGGSFGNYAIWVSKVFGMVLPDISVLLAVIDPQRTDPGMPIDIVARIGDEGDGPTDPFTVAFSLIREDGFSVALGTAEHPGLRAGQIETTRHSFTIPRDTPAGRYHVEVVADPENRIREYSDRNNKAVTDAAIDVTGAP